MHLSKEKSKKLIMIAALGMLSSCAYFKSHPDDLKNFEQAIDSEAEIAIKITGEAPVKSGKNGKK
jgi:hypothetical protein